MDREIKQIYIGLPDHLKGTVFWVGREFRTNPLSHEEGGCDVVVEYQTDEVFGYDWIKMPSRYVSAIFFKRTDIDRDEFEEYSTPDQLIAVKEDIRGIYARKWEKLDDRDTVPFQEVWNSEHYEVSPWELLKEFDHNPTKLNRNQRYGGQNERFGGDTLAAEDDLPF